MNAHHSELLVASCPEEDPPLDNALCFAHFVFELCIVFLVVLLHCLLVSLPIQMVV